MLVTPTASLPSPVPTAGISDAGRAGFSIETNNSATLGEAAVESASNATGDAINAPTATEKSPANDLGPSFFVGDGSEIATSGGPSVAEIARQFQAEKATHNARVLGNEDVQKILNNKSGVTMARNMPPLGPGSLEQGAQPQGQAGVTQSAAQPPPQVAQTSASANQQGQNGVSGPAGTPPPAAANQKQPAEAGTSADNATIPQINGNQQTNDAQGGRRLPATATFLPLLGLLGLVSGGIGLCFRKFRK